MIENLMIVTTSASSVNVIFNVPAKPNGLITGYLISYNGMRNVSLKLFTTTIVFFSLDVVKPVDPFISYEINICTHS